MKKLLLLSAIAGISFSSSAQKRLSLFEEYSGENCAPCALYNPGLWTLVSSGTNPDNILLIKYQVPIPSAGPIYLSYITVNDARLRYYFPTSASAPTGLLNGGIVPGSTDYHINNLKQPAIDAATAAGSPFNIDVTAAYNASGDSVTTTVKVTCVTAYAPSGASLKLRIGMIEHLVYATAPGTNGEKDFHNVVREMYPDAAGTGIAGAWTVGMTQTYVVKGKVRPFVKKTNGPKMVAWIQNETDKTIPQAGLSAELPKTFATNIATSAVNTSGKTFNCAGGSLTGTTITLTNPGTSTASAATIYYRVGTGAWASQPWTGTLAAGGTTSVTLGSIALPATTGTYLLTDSVVFAGDQDVLDNVASSVYVVASTTPVALPISTDWEASTFPTGFLMPGNLGTAGDSWLWANFTGSSGIGHSGKNIAYYPLFVNGTGASGTMIMPTPAISGKVSLDFWEAYAQQTAADNDKLEVVYSTDCGSSWKTIWSATGSAHATTAPSPVTTSLWIPTALSSWVKRSIDISSLPANSILGMKATSGGGNTLFIDDINIRAGLSVTEGAEIVNNITVGPNPASSFANVSFNLVSGTKVQVVLVDVMGKVVSQVADENMTSGNHQLTINTSAVAAGIYMVKINTDKGSVTERLSVVK